MITPNFCDDLKNQIHTRTEALLADPDQDFTAKATALNHIASNSLSYAPSTVHARATRAAAEGSVVAALVHCEQVPCTEAVFLGRLAAGDPLNLTAQGVGLAVQSGLLVRVNTANDGNSYRFAPTGTCHEADGPVPVADTELRVLHNRLIPARFRASPMTVLADMVIAQIDGLDFKICHEGSNVPQVDERGRIAGTYDRLGLVSVLGAGLYRELYQQV